MSSDRTRARSGSPYEDRYGFCRAVRIGDRVCVAGTAPIAQDGGDVPTDAHGQMLLCGQIALAALEQLGCSAEDVVRTRMYLVDAADADDVGRAHRSVFGDHPPAATMVVVAALLEPSWRVEIEVEALA